MLPLSVVKLPSGFLKTIVSSVLLCASARERQEMASRKNGMLNLMVLSVCSCSPEKVR